MHRIFNCVTRSLSVPESQFDPKTSFQTRPKPPGGHQPKLAAGVLGPQNGRLSARPILSARPLGPQPSDRHKTPDLSSRSQRPGWGTKLEAGLGSQILRFPAISRHLPRSVAVRGCGFSGRLARSPFSIPGSHFPRTSGSTESPLRINKLIISAPCIAGFYKLSVFKNPRIAPRLGPWEICESCSSAASSQTAAIARKTPIPAQRIDHSARQSLVSTNYRFTPSTREIRLCELGSLSPWFSLRLASCYHRGW